MREIASIEIHLLVKELSASLDGAFFRKFYDLGDGSFKLQLSKDRRNRLLYCSLLKTFNETEFSEEAESASNFAIAVRKRLDGTRLKSITQHGSDRIIVMAFEGREKHNLIFEMFGKGNLVVTGASGKIELVYKPLRQKERELLPNRQYLFPESDSPAFEGINEEQLDKVFDSIKDSDARVITALSKYVNIGPLYLEDTMMRTGVNPKESARATRHQHQNLKAALLKFLKDADVPSPALYSENGQTVDYAITPISKYERMQKTTFKSVSALFDQLYVSERTASKGDEKRQRELEEANANVEAQKSAVKKLKEEEARSAAAAHSIFARAHEINELIAYLKEKKRVTPEELQSAFKNIKIKAIDLKNKTVTIELEE